MIKNRNKEENDKKGIKEKDQRKRSGIENGRKLERREQEETGKNETKKRRI